MKLKITMGIIAVFAVLLMFQPTFANNLKFIQISDSHVSFSDAHSSRDTENAALTLKETVKDINTVSKVDFVVFTGDNIDRADNDDLKSFLKIVNKLKVPYYVVIGNHEVSKSQKFTKEDYMRTVRRHSKNCRALKPNYIFKKKGYVFIVVDGTKEVIPGPAGYYTQKTLKWLDKKLTKYAGSRVILVQHYPIEPPYYNRTHATYKVEEYKEVLSKHSNVIAVISGHYHANGEKLVDGVYHISTPSLMESPHDYKIIEVEQIKNHPIIYTQLRHAEQ